MSLSAILSYALDFCIALFISLSLWSNWKWKNLIMWVRASQLEGSGRLVRSFYYDRKFLCGNEGSKVHNFHFAKMKDLNFLTFYYRSFRSFLDPSILHFRMPKKLREITMWALKTSDSVFWAHPVVVQFFAIFYQIGFYSLMVLPNVLCIFMYFTFMNHSWNLFILLIVKKVFWSLGSMNNQHMTFGTNTHDCTECHVYLLCTWTLWKERSYKINTIF